MDAQLAIAVESVSKKFCRRLRRSVLYGIRDTSRNLIGLRTQSHELRPGEFWALDEVSLEVARGQALGLIGANGGGKSTLLKLINAIYWPDRGRVSVRGRVGALIAVGAGFHPELTGAENIRVNGAILGMSKADIDREYRNIVDFSEIGDFLDSPVKYYSTGMYVRLGFAVAAFSRPDVMLVDEVLAVGDSSFQSKCFARMDELRSRGTTFVVVSHSMETIANFVDRTALVHNAKLELYGLEDGIARYNEIQNSKVAQDSGSEQTLAPELEVLNLRLDKTRLNPGDAVGLELDYRATRDFEDVELDIELIDHRDASPQLRVSNRDLGRELHLQAGAPRRLRVDIGDLRLRRTSATLVLRLWTRGRGQQLVNRRTQLEFASGVGQGRTALPIEISEAALDLS